jgi:Xaa-Pro aminopeptidase
MDATTYFDLEAEIEKSRGLAPKPPSAEQTGRFERVRAALGANDLDGLFVYGSAESNSDPIRFLCNYVNVFPSASSLLVIPREGPSTLLIDQAWHLELAAEMSWVEDVRVFPPASAAGAPEAIAALLADVMGTAGLTRGRVGIFRLATPSLFVDALSSAVPDVTLAPGEPVWRHVVTTPSPYDLDMIRTTARIADGGFEAAVEAAGAGVTEYEVCMAALSRMASLGAEFLHGSGVSTHINIGSHNAARSNIRPFLYTTARLEPGQMFWLDLSASYGGYYVDSDRTLAVGEPSPEQRRLYEVAREMYDAMRGELRAGVPASDVWKAGSRIAIQAGLGSHSNLGYLGHTTGITTSIRPLVNEPEELTLAAGSVVNLEPGIFVPGVGSACVEDAFVVGRDGADPINGFPLDIQVV